MLKAFFATLLISLGLNIYGKEKPNIIFIMADDLGYGDLGCYGQEKIKTPQLDKMADEGMRFTDFYAGNTVCAPSRYSLMTGKHPGHAHVRGNFEVGAWHSFLGQLPIPEEDITLFDILKKEGYKTAAYGKWGLGRAESSGAPDRNGVDDFYGYNCQRQAHSYYPYYLEGNRGEKLWLGGNDRKDGGMHYSHDLITEKAMDFLKENKDRPFFLYLPYTLPHTPFMVPELGIYDNENWDVNLKKQAAMISRLDRDVGRILNLLKTLGIDENTIVFFTSDNGAHGDGGTVDFFNACGPLRGRKTDLYEGGIRIPMIVRWPGKVSGGTTSDHAAAFWDIMPTFAEIANGQLPAQNTDGISFLPELLGKKQSTHEFLYWEYYNTDYQWTPDFETTQHQLKSQAVRMDEWKAVRHNLRKDFRNEAVDFAPVELYNLDNDISESNNLAEKHPELAKKMLNVMNTEHEPSEYFNFAEAQEARPTEARLLMGGNYADPSILKHNDAYYLTHQSGKFRPGLLIWKSDDMRTWRPLAYALQNFDGNVWAPDLIEHEGTFYLYFIAIYNGKFENFVITADRPEGPWSEAKSVNMPGHIDPGHVVGRDGKRYLHFWEGLVTELSEDGLEVVSEPKKVMDAWPIPDDWAIECVCLESPKLTFHNDWYYLTAAQGGTFGPSTSHMVTSFRSKNATGLWEMSPHNPVIHTWSRQEEWWSKGHGTLVEGPAGQWFIVFHGIRNNYRSLGRSTLMEPIEWGDDGWYFVPEKWPMGWEEPFVVSMPLSDNFNGKELGVQWQFYDQADKNRLSFENGQLLMKGVGENPGTSCPLTVVPRDKSYEVEAELTLHGDAEAGLMLFVSENEYVALAINKDGQIKRRLKQFQKYKDTDEPKVAGRSVKFKIVNHHQDVTFFFKTEDSDWKLMQPALEVSGNGIMRPALFVSGEGKAEFEYFKYTEKP